MNTRLQKIAAEAGIYYYRNGKLQQDTERLIEMVVKECARISIEADDTMTNQGAASAQAFMEHFGVKE